MQSVLVTAFFLLAIFRPHPALVIVAILAPLLTVFRLVPAWDADAFGIAVLVGAAIAATRPRRNALRAQRPSIAVPTAVFAAVAVGTVGNWGAAPVLYGIALTFVTARHGRDGVMRPIHLAWAGAIGGLVAVAIEGIDEGSGGIAAVVINLPVGILALPAFLWMVIAFTWRVVRALKANPWDRVLIGSIAALTALVVVWIARNPFTNGVVMWPLSILLGATIARADGDAQPPLAALRNPVPLGATQDF